MRARLWMTLFAAVATAGPIGGLEAQEIQVPMDETGRIQVMTSELTRRLGLFADVAGLREARLFQRPDTTFVLELTAISGDVLRRERRSLSAVEAAEFRRDVTMRITARARSAGLDQGGRTKLLVGTTILGLGYYGWATAMALDPDDDKASVAAYMLTAAGSFFVPFLATRNRTVPDAVATMALWGAMRGPLHGVLVSDLGNPERDKTRYAWSIGVGAAEAIIGGVVAQSLGMTSGRAELTGAGGDIGLGSGWVMADLFRLDERYDSVRVSDPAGGDYSYPVRNRTLQAAVTLAGSGLGLAGGYLLGATEEWTRGDATIFRNVTAITSVAGVAVGDLIQQPTVRTEILPGGGTYSYVEDGFSRTPAATGLIGTAAGVVLGRALVKGRNFTTGQGTLLTLAPVAGGLLGVGIAYLATPERQYIYDPATPYRDPNDHSELYLTMGAVGAGAAFAVLYPAMARHAGRSEQASNLRFSVNPLAPAQLLGGTRDRIVLGSVHYRF